MIFLLRRPRIELRVRIVVGAGGKQKKRQLLKYVLPNRQTVAGYMGVCVCVCVCVRVFVCVCVYVRV